MKPMKVSFNQSCIENVKWVQFTINYIILIIDYLSWSIQMRWPCFHIKYMSKLHTVQCLIQLILIIYNKVEKKIQICIGSSSTKTKTEAET